MKKFESEILSCKESIEKLEHYFSMYNDVVTNNLNSINLSHVWEHLDYEKKKMLQENLFPNGVTVNSDKTLTPNDVNYIFTEKQ